MREFEPYGVPFVVEALKKVISEEGADPLLALDEQAGNVRRIRPMEAQSDAWSRSVYVVGHSRCRWLAKLTTLERFRSRRVGGEHSGEARKVVRAVWSHQRRQEEA